MDQVFKSPVVIGVVILVGLLVVPWGWIHWGGFELAGKPTISMLGQARQDQVNQVAQFTAGVMAVNADRATAVNEVNKKVEELITALKEFGIAQEQIKTQNLSVYRSEDPITEGGRQRFEPGDWRVSNDIQVTLEDVNQAAALADLLTRSGATNVYGPNFGLEDTQEYEADLLAKAVDNAREKAEVVARSQGRSVGGVVSIVETGASGGIMPMMEARGLGGGGGVPIEPGTGTVVKQVSVSFELR